MSVVRYVGAMLMVSAVFGALAACGERPQRVVSDGEGAYNLQTGSALAERTRNQGEAERIGY